MKRIESSHLALAMLAGTLIAEPANADMVPRPPSVSVPSVPRVTPPSINVRPPIINVPNVNPNINTNIRDALPRRDSTSSSRSRDDDRRANRSGSDDRRAKRTGGDDSDSRAKVGGQAAAAAASADNPGDGSKAAYEYADQTAMAKYDTDTCDDPSTGDYVFSGRKPMATFMPVSTPSTTIPSNAGDPGGDWFVSLLGALRVAGAGLEGLAGLGLLETPLAPLGYIVGADATQRLVAGSAQTVTGQQVDNPLSQFAQWWGWNRDTANTADSVVGVVANLGSVGITLAYRIPAILAENTGLGLSWWQVLWLHEKGSVALTDKAFETVTNTLGPTTAAERGFVMSLGKFPVPVPNIVQSTLNMTRIVGTGGTPAGTAVSGAIGAGLTQTPSLPNTKY
jgi:hypothetical protein